VKKTKNRKNEKKKSIKEKIGSLTFSFFRRSPSTISSSKLSLSYKDVTVELPWYYSGVTVLPRCYSVPSLYPEEMVD
jgi:hypothetical protein